MSSRVKIVLFCYLSFVEAFIIEDRSNNTVGENASKEENSVVVNETVPTQAFDGVYSECFLHLSYSCIQEKTLVYLRELNKLNEVSVIGDYVKFVKINGTQLQDESRVNVDDIVLDKHLEDLSFSIDQAVDDFFDNHVLKFKALGKDVSVPNTVEEFVGRKRKGGGGGGGGGGHGGDDGGKKKMMMMAMMCMKMKLMVMVPAMMGMMGMMSFKGMMFSMMSFMMSKMMLLMKILEKKGGGGGGGGGGDGGWAAGGGGGGGAWMPAGGQDYGGGGGGGGGYDANGQWQSRSIIDAMDDASAAPVREYYVTPVKEREPIISYVTPHVRYNHVINDKKPYLSVKNLNDAVIKVNQGAIKTRRKRGLLDILQTSYLYLTNQLLGIKKNTKMYPKYSNYRIVNGVKYVYYPVRPIIKTPRELNQQPVAAVTEMTPIITAEDFNKGEILEGAVESRSMKMKKLKKMKNDVEAVVEEDPWE